MNKKIASVLVGILLIGVISASLLTYFGQITGSVEVKAPTFYPNGHIAEKYYQLKIDEIPDSNEITLVDGENIIFTTESLGINNFYEADYTIYIRAKTNVAGNKLWAELWVLDENEDYKQRICETSFTITATDYFSTKDEICHGSELEMDEGDRIALKIYGAGETTSYTLKVGDYESEDKIMRIEVNAASPTETPEYEEPLEIIINSPIENNTYDKESVPINLTTNIPAKCEYQFWFPVSNSFFNEEQNNTGEEGLSGGISFWFGTNLIPITEILSTQHSANINFGVNRYIAFKCTDEEDNDVHTEKMKVNLAT